ncbi:MAG: hypothetical protein GDA45_07175 [Chromatiales bacterium]|nr:hypothetical protein [Chromatiales bacterium]
MIDQKEIVEAYLKKHFADAQISSAEVPAEKGWGYKLSSAEGLYNLLVLDEAFTSLNAEQATMQLENFQVADVMRSMEGFTVTVTDSGCIFQ